MLNYLERLPCRARLGETARAELRRATAQYRRLALETLDDRLMLTAAPGDTFVTFNTNMGSFQVELFNSTAPQTVANFLSYVDSGAYNNLFFHRVVAGFVAQTGGFNTNGAPYTAATPPTHITQGSPVQNEFHDSNTVGTLAMAKVGGDPNSATSEFFFNLADNSSNLDAQNGGFTVFGKVLGNGMDVINAIAAVKNYDLSNAWGSAFSNVPLLNLTGTVTSLPADDFVVINTITRASVVSGSVFDDASGNGTKDAGEAPLSGFTVYADVNNNGTLDAGDYAAVTDANGNYAIVGLTTGTYTMRVAPNSGWTASTSNGATQQLQVTTGGTATVLPFGETLIAPDAPTLPSNLDTGSSNSDEITSKSQLSFVVTGVTSGATVNIYDILNGSKLIGSAVATGTSVTIAANQPMAEGLYHLVATQTLSGITSPQSQVRGVVVDSTAPVFDTTALPDATKGSNYSTTISTVDAHSSVFSLKSGPAGMQIGATTGILTWPTANVAIGNYQVTIVSTDVAGNATEKTYSLGVDGPPVFDAISAQKVNVGTPLTIKPHVSSIKSLQFTVDVNELPVGSPIVFNNQTGEFTWTPSSTVTPGVYHITFSVTDSLQRTASSGSIAITVNAPPVISAINDVTVNEQLPIALPFTVTDGGTVILSLVGSVPAGAKVQSVGQTSNNGAVTTSGLFIWTPDESQGPGVYTIMIKATDSTGLSTTVPFQVTVNEVDVAPTFNGATTVDVRQGTTAQVQFKASDPDLPSQQLVYSLEPGAPEGVKIDAATGVLTWAVPNQYPTGPLSLTVRATEVGGNALSVTQPVTLNVVTGFTGFDLFTTSAVSLGGYSLGLAVNPGLPINSALSLSPFGSTLPGGLPAQAAALAQLAGIPPIATATTDSGATGHLAAGIVDMVLGFDAGIPHNTEGMEVELARGTGNGQGTGTPGQQQGEIQKAGAIEPIDESREKGGSRGDSSQLQRVAPPEADASNAATFWGPAHARYTAKPVRTATVRRNNLGRANSALVGRNIVPAVPADASAQAGDTKRTVAKAAAGAALVMPLLVADLPERRREAKRNRLKRFIEPLG